MHDIGSLILEKLLNADGGAYKGKHMQGEDGRVYEFVDYRNKEVLTVLGQVKIRRAYYYSRESGKGYCPKDKTLDIEGTSYSPGARRMISRVGAHRSFGLGSEDLYELAGVRVNAKEVERVSEMVGRQVEAFHAAESEASLSDKIVPIKAISKMYVCMDGTGVPAVKKETLGRQGKGEDGKAGTREAKLGCIFTQTGVDKEGRPVRDESSTSYTGAIEIAEDFGWRIYKEAKRRGIDRAVEVSVLGDGAPWIWNIADEHFPSAQQILDLYHAREHYWNAVKACPGIKKEKALKWAEDRRLELDAGKPEDVIKAIKKLLPIAGTDKEICEREAAFFEKNKERMRYADFRRRGLFVGSGVLEAGCKTVIGQRLKQSGMHWTVKGADSIIALRCSLLSNRWESFWAHRACA